MYIYKLLSYVGAIREAMLIMLLVLKMQHYTDFYRLYNSTVYDPYKTTNTQTSNSYRNSVICIAMQRYKKYSQIIFIYFSKWLPPLQRNCGHFVSALFCWDLTLLQALPWPLFTCDLIYAGV